VSAGRARAIAGDVKAVAARRGRRGMSIFAKGREEGEKENVVNWRRRVKRT